MVCQRWQIVTMCLYNVTWVSMEKNSLIIFEFNDVYDEVVVCTLMNICFPMSPLERSLCIEKPSESMHSGLKIDFQFTHTN